MDKELEQKIGKLREMYVGEDDASFINDIERSLRENIVRERFADNPLIQQIIKDAVDRIMEINTLLAYDEKLTEIDRRALFKAREVWQFNLSRFGMTNVANNIKNLRKLIDEKLETDDEEVTP